MKKNSKSIPGFFRKRKLEFIKENLKKEFSVISVLLIVFIGLTIVSQSQTGMIIYLCIIGTIIVIFGYGTVSIFKSKKIERKIIFDLINSPTFKNKKRFLIFTEVLSNYCQKSMEIINDFEEKEGIKRTELLLIPTGKSQYWFGYFFKEFELLINALRNTYQRNHNNAIKKLLQESKILREHLNFIIQHNSEVLECRIEKYKGITIEKYFALGHEFIEKFDQTVEEIDACCGKRKELILNPEGKNFYHMNRYFEDITLLKTFLLEIIKKSYVSEKEKKKNKSMFDKMTQISDEAFILFKTGEEIKKKIEEQIKSPEEVIKENINEIACFFDNQMWQNNSLRNEIISDARQLIEDIVFEFPKSGKSVIIMRWGKNDINQNQGEKFLCKAYFSHELELCDFHFPPQLEVSTLESMERLIDVIKTSIRNFKAEDAKIKEELRKVRFSQLIKKINESRCNSLEEFFEKINMAFCSNKKEGKIFVGFAYKQFMDGLPLEISETINVEEINEPDFYVAMDNPFEGYKVTLYPRTLYYQLKKQPDIVVRKFEDISEKNGINLLGKRAIIPFIQETKMEEYG